MTKYNAKRTTVDGITFASQKEARRYKELKLLERAGEIGDLSLQPVFALEVNGRKCGKYLADFSYYKGNEYIVEDCKSGPTKTPVYRLKKKLVKALYGIDITEV